MDLRNEMHNELRRMALLWSDHFWLTRQFITQAVTKYPGIKENEDRLFKNQVQLGDNLSFFYGPQIGKRYADLLHDHIAIAGEIVGSAIAQKDITNLNLEWQENGKAIALILAQANPHIDFQTMNQHFMNHLKTTLDESVAIIKNEYQNSVTKGDNAKKHVENMSSYIEQALRMQFP